jgi:hypothetical protein
VVRLAVVNPIPVPGRRCRFRSSPQGAVADHGAGVVLGRPHCTGALSAARVQGGVGTRMVGSESGKGCAASAPAAVGQASQVGVAVRGRVPEDIPITIQVN